MEPPPLPIRRIILLCVIAFSIFSLLVLSLYIGWDLLNHSPLKVESMEKETAPQRQAKVANGKMSIVVLPPDPGAAGKTTLQGVDSDGDGVRDDVQRYIALTYPNSEKTRATLTQYTKSIQVDRFLRVHQRTRRNPFVISTQTQ